MITFQMHFQSLQVMFNSFCEKVEQQKVKPEEITSGLETIRKKVAVTLDTAVQNRPDAQADLKKVGESIDTLFSAFAATSNFETCKTSAFGIKKRLTELNITLFSADTNRPQQSSLREEYDQHLATANWIVNRACGRVKEKYPKTYKIMSGCTYEVQNGKYGSALKEAFFQCMPEVWTIEQLTKFALLSLALNKQPLSALDCFEATVENQESFITIATTFAKESCEVVEKLLLLPDSLTEVLKNGSLLLNRFTKMCKIERDDALGLMNLLQENLVKTNYLDEVEELFRHNKPEEALRYAAKLPEEFKRIRALLFLANATKEKALLEKIASFLTALGAGESREDVLQEYVQLVLGKSEQCLSHAYEVSLRINDMRIVDSLLPRIAEEALVLDAPLFLKISTRSFARKPELLANFFELHHASDPQMAIRVVSQVSSQEMQIQMLDSLASVDTWRTIQDCGASAKQILKEFHLVPEPSLAQFVERVSTNNALLALNTGRLIKTEALRNSVMVQLFEKVRLKNLYVAFHAASQLTDEQQKERLLERFYDSVSGKDVQGIINFANAIENQEWKTQFLLRAGAKVVSRNDFRVGYSFLTCQPPIVRDVLLIRLSNSIDVGDNIGLALSLLRQISDMNLRYEEFASRAVLCYEDDSQAVEEILPQVLPIRILDEVYAKIAYKIAFSRPQKAIELAMSISKPEESIKTLDRLQRVFGFYNPSCSSAPPFSSKLAETL